MARSGTHSSPPSRSRCRPERTGTAASAPGTSVGLRSSSHRGSTTGGSTQNGSKLPTTSDSWQARPAEDPLRPGVLSSSCSAAQQASRSLTDHPAAGSGTDWHSPGGEVRLARLPECVVDRPGVGGGRAGAVYLEQVGQGRGDYYAGEVDDGGVWFGAGAGNLGARGSVDEDGLTALLRGRDPISGGELRRVVREGGVSAFDLTFKPPKSVSLLWALGDEGVSAETRAAHDSAWRQALRYLEQEACAAGGRRGKDGVREVRADRFVAAAFAPSDVARRRSATAHACRHREPRARRGRQVGRARQAVAVSAWQDRRLALSGRVAGRADRAAGSRVGSGSPRSRRSGRCSAGGGRELLAAACRGGRAHARARCAFGAGGGGGGTRDAAPEGSASLGGVAARGVAGPRCECE